MLLIKLKERISARTRIDGLVAPVSVLQVIMKKHVIILILTISSTFSFAQDMRLKNLEKWIEKNNIVFNSPTCPEGFEYFQNCNEIHAYRKIIGDTIIVYSRGGSIAEDIEALNKSIQEERFNIYSYPKEIQNNGTIIIQKMRKWTFLSRNDTLYLLDNYDKRKRIENSKILSAFLTGEISETEFNKQTKDNESKDFGFVPKFKMIYFKGIFDKKNNYKFNVNQNFREEDVTLLKSWNENDKTYYKINLKTWTAGKFVISEDFEFINTEICKE